MTDLVFLGLVGIIDPLRPEAIEAVAVARRAGIDVRMITGDHLVTAQAIAAELGLGPGGMSGTEFAATSDDELTAALPELHVFGRVSPQDKLRLVQRMQASGDVVAMTGDAVNDAAALKQADIGVAMGSGSEVSKQAAKMILTDDNFATLVHAVELGRGIFSRITAYIGYQLTQLFGLVSMFLLATILNINDGVALLPLMVLFLNFTLAVIPVIIISIDEPEPGLMDLPPRDPRERIFNRTTATRWIGLGLLLGVLSLLPLAFGPDEPSDGGGQRVGDDGLRRDGAVHRARPGLVMRKTTASAFARPVVPAALLDRRRESRSPSMSTEVGFLQGFLRTTELTGGQWAACIGLAAVFAAAPSRSRRGSGGGASPRGDQTPDPVRRRAEARSCTPSLAYRRRNRVLRVFTEMPRSAASSRCPSDVASRSSSSRSPRLRGGTAGVDVVADAEAPATNAATACSWARCATRWARTTTSSDRPDNARSIPSS